MMMTKILYLALLLLCSTKCLAATIELEPLVMQLRAKVDTENDDLLGAILDKTTAYMDSYFGAYYANTEPQDYFSHAALSVNSFGIHGVHHSFITTLEFDGKLFFNSDPPPSPNFVNTLLSNAFQGLNLDLYLESVLEADNPFLSTLTHIIIEINGAPLTETNLEETDIDTTGGDVGVEPEEGWSLDDWAEIAVYATAGVVGSVLLVAAFFLFKYCFYNNQIENDPAPIKVKTIEIPSRPSAPPQQNPRRKKSLHFKKNNTDTFFNANLNGRERSPSPVRSLASQDSSLFTFNPKGTSVGSLSTMNTDMPSIDLEAWTRHNTISPVNPAPFGHNISAIETDQLSLIEEGDEGGFRSRERQRHHSRKSSSALEVRKSRSRNYRAPSRATSHQPGRMLESRGSDYSTEESSTMGNDSSSDVISDLRNLSLQIDKHRRSRATGH